MWLFLILLFLSKVCFLLIYIFAEFKCNAIDMKTGVTSDAFGFEFSVQIQGCLWKFMQSLLAVHLCMWLMGANVACCSTIALVVAIAIIQRCYFVSFGAVARELESL